MARACLRLCLGRLDFSLIARADEEGCRTRRAPVPPVVVWRGDDSPNTMVPTPRARRGMAGLHGGGNSFVEILFLRWCAYQHVTSAILWGSRARSICGSLHALPNSRGPRVPFSVVFEGSHNVDRTRHCRATAVEGCPPVSRHQDQLAASRAIARFRLARPRGLVRSGTLLVPS
jgi:hypothetical protein